jgi:hypothetical protein
MIWIAVQYYNQNFLKNLKNKTKKWLFFIQSMNSVFLALLLTMINSNNGLVFFKKSRFLIKKFLKF